MKILVWATTFGADLWSLTKYLSSNNNNIVKVVMSKPEKFKKEAVWQLFPLKAQLIKRRKYMKYLRIPFFKPDVTIVDNWFPVKATSPNGFVLWHGFGWRGGHDLESMKPLHSTISKLWGDTFSPNPNFRWQCFGNWDFEYRTKLSGFHPYNCKILGAAMHDDLIKPLDKKLIRHLFPFDIVNRKTVLIAPTWHYGELFAHWGTDAQLLTRLIDYLENKNINIIFRLHDSFRFSKPYIMFLKDLQSKFPSLVMKFKDTHPDNYIDMQIADVLVTNFSGIADLFYATKKPTVHIYPVKHVDEEYLWRKISKKGVITKKTESARFIWKLPPEDNGGLLARSFDELLITLAQAIENPDCCREKAQAFLDKYLLGADGNSCKRITDSLTELIQDR